MYFAPVEMSRAQPAPRSSSFCVSITLPVRFQPRPPSPSTSSSIRTLVDATNPSKRLSSSYFIGWPPLGSMITIPTDSSPSVSARVPSPTLAGSRVSRRLKRILARCVPSGMTPANLSTNLFDAWRKASYSVPKKAKILLFPAWRPHKRHS